MVDAGQLEVEIAKVAHVDLSELLPLMRAYCEFYETSPRDDRLVGLMRALLDDPSEGVQYLAREGSGRRAVGFATIFWSWSTTEGIRIGIMNDLFVSADARGVGVGRKLIEACRGACRRRGVAKLTWETAPDNAIAQRLYDSTGAQASAWRAYELEAW